MTERESLFAAWQAWDDVCLRMPRRPPPHFGEREANEMEDACKAVAPEWPTRFRSELTAARRGGLDYPAAVDRALAHRSGF